MRQAIYYEAGPVLHPFEPDFTSAVGWPMRCLVRMPRPSAHAS